MPGADQKQLGKSENVKRSLKKWRKEVAIKVGGTNDGWVMGKICQAPPPMNALKKCPPRGPGKNGQQILSRVGGVVEKRVSSPPQRNVEDPTNSRGLGGQN